MRIYLIRHADPDYEADSLTPAGQREAEALADHLSQLGIDEIYSSPRGRAVMTAQYTADRLGLPVQVEAWSTEMDSLHSQEYNCELWDLNGAVLRAPDVLAHLDSWDKVSPLDNPRLAEHIHDIRAGSLDFLQRQGFTKDGHIYRFTEPNHKAIAFFAHLGFGLTWLADLLDIPLPLMWAGFYLHPSSVTTILFDERSPNVAVPRVLGLGDLSHIYLAGLVPSRVGIIGNYE